MTVKSTMQRLAALIEFVVASGMAIIFHLVLHNDTAALSIFGIGLLVSLATWLLREDIVELRQKMLKDYAEFHELPEALHRIQDPECLQKGQQIVARVTRNMALLQKGIIPLDETEFMLEATKAANATQRSITSVNPLTPGWNKRGAIIKYYQANKKALERGVEVSRTFVMRREQLAEPEVQEMLRVHYRDGIEVKIIYRDDLPACGEAGWAKGCSFNFGIYDDRLVVDVSAPPPYFGIKTSEREEVEHYLHLIDLVDHSAHPVTLDGDRVVEA